MKPLIILSLVGVVLFKGFDARAQEIPPGAVNVTFSCAIKAGYTMRDVVDVARRMTMDENAPNTIFFREPWVVNTTFNDSYDFLVVSYYSSFAEMVERFEARQAPNSTRMTPSSRRHFLEMTECDLGGRFIDVLRTIPGGNAYDGNTSDETLVATRSCDINPGQSIRQVYNYMNEVTQRWQDAGDNTLIQVAHTVMGSRPDVEARTRVWIRRIGANATDLANRLDQQNRMLFAGSTRERPMTCRDSHLWKSYVIHRSDNQQ